MVFDAEGGGTQQTAPYAETEGVQLHRRKQKHKLDTVKTISTTEKRVDLEMNRFMTAKIRKYLHFTSLPSRAKLLSWNVCP